VLDVHFVIVGVVIGAIGQASYVRDTVLGRSHPNRVTWFLWMAAPFLAFAAEIQSGVGLRALLPFTAGLGPLVVLLATFRNRTAVWRLSRLDVACGLLAAVGLVGWLATRQGVIAITASVAVDTLAWLPTIVKSWQEPDSESTGIWAGGLINASLTLLTLHRLTYTVAAFPGYSFVVAATQLVLVGGQLGPRVRRRRSGTQPAVPVRM
jgi:hypothetical protein